ncbi:MAG: hypothetical protein LAO56_18540 [Acidobacteriia bacterium]|nr:hypothetical protein [Terriglobia bacterium]
MLCGDRGVSLDRHPYYSRSKHQERLGLAFVRVFRRIFLDCLPRPIEAHWDPVYGPRLAGFPVNICYADLRGEHGPYHATYYFDPRTFSEDSEARRMRYYPKPETLFWVEVVISKISGSSEARKYRGEGLVSAVVIFGRQ